MANLRLDILVAEKNGELGGKTDSNESKFSEGWMNLHNCTQSLVKIYFESGLYAQGAKMHVYLSRYKKPSHDSNGQELSDNPIFILDNNGVSNYSWENANNLEQTLTDAFYTLVKKHCSIFRN